MLISAGQNPVVVHVAKKAASPFSTGGPRSVMKGPGGDSIHIHESNGIRNSNIQYDVIQSINRIQSGYPFL